MGLADLGYIPNPMAGSGLVGLDLLIGSSGRAGWLSVGRQNRRGGGHLVVKWGEASVMGQPVVVLST